ncbi:MAG: efflux RND transporter permease subunit [Leptospiraceae bacterium]|nr:efflux RND transporter permease subunit [Leptospiraceae bacterium]
MIAQIINASLKNRSLVIILALAIVLIGIRAISLIPVDAIPDLSDVQVIVYTEYEGQAPQVVEDQVTYPLTSSMLSVPGAQNVRGYSFFGFSMVYIIFEDGTDMYWARSRVLEYLNYAAGRLPEGVKPQLGPDATGVGWVYQYILTDPSGQLNLQQLRSIQDWQIRYELASLEGVAEVASLGGFVKQYQAEIDPTSLLLHNISLRQVQSALANSNRDTGGRLIEMGETEYMVRGLGYIKSTKDIESIVLRADQDGTPITIADVAHVSLGPDIRRGIAEWNGEGEVVSGIVVMRFGENPLEVINRVKARLKEIKPGLPPSLEIKTGYDRSVLIKRAIRNVSWTLTEEMIVVAIIIMLFLMHARSALVAICTLPIGILASLSLMEALGINANIMSLGGIAIAIGVMVDASIVLVENIHKHKEVETGLPHIETVRRASLEVGPALFFSLLIITISFLPILLLQGQSGRLFRPLAITKSFAMAAASVIAITIIPVLASFFVTGKTRPESESRLAQFFIRVYEPMVRSVLDHKKRYAMIFGFISLISIVPVIGIPWFNHSYLIRPIGGEFMPPLNEGDILYMPTTLPGISITKAREILQKTDRIIKAHPEVKQVLGKIGRAQTATDPAPLSMVETTILLKDKSEWRSGMTIEKIIAELNQSIQFPGLTNAWTYPIRTRIDMLATGIKTPVGIKIMGDDLDILADYSSRLEALFKQVPGTSTVVSERVTGGRYIDYEIDREAAARYGLTIADIQHTIMTAVGGKNITFTVEGLARYPINIRYPRELRDNLQALGDVWIRTPGGADIPISRVAHLRVHAGPPAIKTENARKTAWIYIDLKQGRDVASYVSDARALLQRSIDQGKIKPPKGVSLVWSGQFEYMQKAAARLKAAGLATLMAIIFLLYLHFKNFIETSIILGCLAFSVTGGLWMMYLLDYNRSVATDVGFIALAGLSVETGIVLLVYLDNVMADYKRKNRLTDQVQLRQAIMDGVVSRVRPKIMTTLTTLLGLVPIMWSTEAGSRIMKRLATPLIGGLVTDTMVTLLIIPLIYEWIQQRRLKHNAAGPLHAVESNADELEEIDEK